MVNPLEKLPSELILHILQFTPLASLAALTRLNTSWHTFIDDTHQDSIYSSLQTPAQLPGANDFSFLSDSPSFSKYTSPDSVASWKELCRRQTLLARNWNQPEPLTQECIYQIGHESVWRFRPDFKRRFILSTSHTGGFNVTDMDGPGTLIWRLGAEVVRPFAHMEYQDGTAVWDREGNSVEVWRTGIDGLPRGHFRRVAVLDHDRMTMGFQLSYSTLCVVSPEGEGYVYTGMTSGQPRLRTKIENLDHGAVGHLDQCEDAVVYSLGAKGYHFYDKGSGEMLGVLHPHHCSSFSHIKLPDSAISDYHIDNSIFSPTAPAFPPRNSSKDRTEQLQIRRGPLPSQQGEILALDQDEWGAGMFDRESNLFVGISRGGRVLVSTDWRKSLASVKDYHSTVSIIECQTGDRSHFDLGGWLSVKNQKIMLQVQDRIYLLGLTKANQLAGNDRSSSTPSLTFASCLSSRLSIPVSFMAIYDDCIMATFATLRTRRQSIQHTHITPDLWARRWILPTKVIRVLSFAPSTDPLNPEEEHFQATGPIRTNGMSFDRLFGEGVDELIERVMGGEEIEILEEYDEEM